MRMARMARSSGLMFPYQKKVASQSDSGERVTWRRSIPHQLISQQGPFARHHIAEIDHAEALAIVREQIALLDLDLALTVVVGRRAGTSDNCNSRSGGE